MIELISVVVDSGAGMRSERSQLSPGSVLQTILARHFLVIEL